MRQQHAEVDQHAVAGDEGGRAQAAALNAKLKSAREPTVAELAAETGLRREQIGNLLAAERQPRALDAASDREGDGGVGGRTIDSVFKQPKNLQQPTPNCAGSSYLNEHGRPAGNVVLPAIHEVALEHGAENAMRTAGDLQPDAVTR